jgi:hypothetical protein
VRDVDRVDDIRALLHRHATRDARHDPAVHKLQIVVVHRVLVDRDRAARHDAIHQRRRGILAEQVKPAADQIRGGEIGRAFELPEGRDPGRQVIFDQLAHTLAGEGAVLTGQGAPGDGEGIAGIHHIFGAFPPCRLELGDGVEVGAARRHESRIDGACGGPDEEVGLDVVLQQRAQGAHLERSANAAAAEYKSRCHCNLLLITCADFVVLLFCPCAVITSVYQRLSE